MVEVSPDIASKRQSVPRAAQWKDNNSPHNSQDDNLQDHNNSHYNNPQNGNRSLMLLNER